MKNYYVSQDYFGKTHRVSLDPYNLFLTKVFTPGSSNYMVVMCV